VNDAEKNAQKRRLRPLIKKWRSALGLHHWDIDHDFYEGAIPDSNGDAAFTDALATTTSRWQYLTAVIRWRIDLMAETKDDELERAVVHEYCHVLVNEMRTMREDGREGRMADAYDTQHEERVCSELTQAFLWTYQAGGEAQ